jgi:hypothetical protein
MDTDFATSARTGAVRLAPTWTERIIVPVTLLVREVIRHPVAAKLEPAVRRTAVAVPDVAVVALLAGIEIPVTTFKQTVLVAAVSVIVVAVVALFTQGPLQDPITAELILTISRASIAADHVAVIALFVWGIVEDPITAELELTPGVAAVPVVVVAIITLLSRLQDAVAAGRTAQVVGVAVIEGIAVFVQAVGPVERQADPAFHSGAQAVA